MAATGAKMGTLPSLVASHDGRSGEGDMDHAQADSRDAHPRLSPVGDGGGEVVVKAAA